MQLQSAEGHSLTRSVGPLVSESGMTPMLSSSVGDDVDAAASALRGHSYAMFQGPYTRLQ